jgi:hypothetical protein
MAYVRTADELHHFVATTAQPSTNKPKNARGFFRRAFEAMVDGRRRSAELEITAYLETRGQYLTDEAEREIDRILSSSTRF